MIKLTQRDGKGFIAIEWVVGMVLLIVPTFMLSLSLLQYPPRKSLSQVAASEAARAYVQEGNPSDAKNAANITLLIFLHLHLQPESKIRKNV